MKLLYQHYKQSSASKEPKAVQIWDGKNSEAALFFLLRLERLTAPVNVLNSVRGKTVLVQDRPGF